jgi:hypothetical protein
VEHVWWECEAGHHPISVGTLPGEPKPPCPECGGVMKKEPNRKYPKVW